MSVAFDMPIGSACYGCEPDGSVRPEGFCEGEQSGAPACQANLQVEGSSVVSARFDGLGAGGKPVRLGIMGGTFDPIHIGHLAIAEQAREDAALDAVVFVPAGVPVFKLDRKVASAADRLAMCRLAVAGNPAFDVSDIEIRRSGNTYTVDTLREMRAHYPENVEFFFIIGADAVASIAKWRESDALAKLARLIAVARPGFSLSEELKHDIAQAGKFDVTYLQATALSVSSSDLRERIAQGRSIRYLVPEGVRAYIQSKGLYGEGSVSLARSGEGRFQAEGSHHERGVEHVG